MSFDGKQYSDNPRYISEKLHEISPKTEIVWLLNEGCRENVPDYVRCVPFGKREMKRELTDAAAWVDNSFIFAYAHNELFKGKSQLYIQTWHGDRGFKKCGYDWMGFTSDTRGIERGFCDLTLAGSETIIPFFRNSYHLKGEIIMSGCPRNDCLVHRDRLREYETRQRLGITNRTKILLYAPTFRDDGDNSQLTGFLRDINNVLEACRLYCDQEWVCLVRAHHLSDAFSGESKVPDCMDVSSYPDMAELLAVADLLITDYSSSAGDFVLKKDAPIILYQPDREHFSEKDREMLFDIDRSPYLVAKTMQDLCTVISDLKQINIRENCDAILQFYRAHEDGNASERVAKKIVAHIESVHSRPM